MAGTQFQRSGSESPPGTPSRIQSLMDKKKPSAAVKKPRSKGTAKAKALRKKPALKAAHDVDAVSDTGAVGKKAKLTNTGKLAAMEGWGIPKPGHVKANDDLGGDSEDLRLTSLSCESGSCRSQSTSWRQSRQGRQTSG